ncbi:ssl1498 family light-harvesting-like protein [Euhalothece natronophila Z-M001]|uniref:Ssl1498 family light-harvesting-like protein n=1 Tax=Euhalothece natronophila Z-M001 TaxID=522448 RepID=A0A5B8NK36_9CHRO|nr:ssl1498 family light-harvesting-like protein [Euhalothece natronophila]QDZ38685.1 ssl1498 family light-harvesting-like protein [Euhalothece natronophila Z-M001]
MPYTKEDGGRLNNFAVQPKMYVAEPPNKKQKRNYIVMGAISLLLVSGLVFVAFSIS